jgi:hypothetical protein
VVRCAAQDKTTTAAADGVKARQGVSASCKPVKGQQQAAARRCNKRRN